MDVDARNKSIAVRFNFGTGSVPMGETVSAPPLVTPDLFRGPDCQAPLSPGFPGPRNKSGVTTGGAEMVSPVGVEPVSKLNRTAVEQVQA